MAVVPSGKRFGINDKCTKPFNSARLRSIFSFFAKMKTSVAVTKPSKWWKNSVYMKKQFLCAFWRFLHRSIGMFLFFQKNQKSVFRVVQCRQKPEKHDFHVFLHHRSSVKTLSSQKVFFVLPSENTQCCYTFCWFSTFPFNYGTQRELAFAFTFNYGWLTLVRGHASWQQTAVFTVYNRKTLDSYNLLNTILCLPTWHKPDKNRNRTIFNHWFSKGLTKKHIFFL